MTIKPDDYIGSEAHYKDLRRAADSSAYSPETLGDCGRLFSRGLCQLAAATGLNRVGDYMLRALGRFIIRRR